MKNLTTVAMLLLLAVAVSTSCKKENVSVKNDFQINQEIDRKFENIINLSKPEINNLVIQKWEVMERIINDNPGITFERLYPYINKPTANNAVGCVSQYNSSMTNCNILFVGNAFISAIIAVGAGVVGTPVAGVGTGVTLILKDALNFKACATTALMARDACIKNQK